jgi:hypothetical protein
MTASSTTNGITANGPTGIRNMPGPQWFTAVTQVRAAIGETVSFVARRSHWPIALLTVMVIVQAVVLKIYYVPVSGGTDQNGYHVTARLLSEGTGAGFTPASPYSFIGNMMVLTERGRVYAKYPPGYPLLAAMARLVGGPGAVYLVNPLCMAAACALSFFLFRLVISDFMALLGVTWLMWNPLTLIYANDANSHASTLLFVVLGMWGLLSWLNGRPAWRGIVGAFALAYAATIRYSEFLLFLPLLFVVVARVWSDGDRRTLRQSALLVFSWMLPIAALACYCWVAFGAPWKTGYAYCAEETGFGLKYFFYNPVTNRPGNWETLLVQANWLGLFLLWPAGLAGLILLAVSRWRIGVTLALWAIPSTALYLMYYWAPGGDSTTSYLRFFISVLPAFILAALWLIERGLSAASKEGMPPAISAAVIGLLTAFAVAINLWNTTSSLQMSLAYKSMLADSVHFAQARVPLRSALFVGDEEFSNCVDAAGGYDLYNLQLFQNSTFQNLNQILANPSLANEPDPRQRARIQMYWRLLGDKGAVGSFVPKSNEELKQAQDRLLDQLARSHTRAFFLLKTGQNQDLLPDPSNWQSRIVASQVCYPGSATLTPPVGGWTIAGRSGPPQPPNPVTWTLFEVRPIHPSLSGSRQ